MKDIILIAVEVALPIILGYLREWATGITRDLSEEEHIMLLNLLDRLIHTDVE